MKIYLIAVVLLTGCTNTSISKKMSSGAIGCPANQIAIQNETASGFLGGMHNWTAICNGTSYVCSYQETTGVNCSASENNEQRNLESIGGL